MRVVLLQCRKDASTRGREIDGILATGDLRPDELAVVQAFEGELTPSILDDADMLLIGGSAWSVFEAIPHYAAFAEVLREAARRKLPTLGICFGSQALAHVFGGSVVRDEAHAEYGTVEIERAVESDHDPLFKALPRRFDAQEAHHDRIRSLPPGGVELARSVGDILQAFRLADAPIYGTQFHPERSAEDFRRLTGPGDETYPPEQAARMRATLRESPYASLFLENFIHTLGGTRMG